MSNIFNCIDAIDEVSLESEIEVLESMLISLDKSIYVYEHAESIDKENPELGIIYEQFIMEAKSDDKSVGDKIATGVQGFAKKIGDFIAKLFKKNPGKAEMSSKDKKELGENVKKAKKGPLRWVDTKFKRIAVGATIAAGSTGIRFAYVKHKIKKEEAAEKSNEKWGSLKNGLDSIDVSESGEVKFNFTMKLSTFGDSLRRATPAFIDTVNSVMKLRSDHVAKKNKTAIAVDDKYSEDFLKGGGTASASGVTKALESLSQPFKDLYATYKPDGVVETMTLDEWNDFSEKVSKLCTDIGENLTRLNDWMPSRNAGDKETMDAKAKRIRDDFHKANPLMTDKELDVAIAKTYGTKMFDETRGDKRVLDTLRNTTNFNRAQLTHIRNIMTDIRKDYVGLEAFLKEVGSRVNTAVANNNSNNNSNSNNPAIVTGGNS